MHTLTLDSQPPGRGGEFPFNPRGICGSDTVIPCPCAIPPAAPLGPWPRRHAYFVDNTQAVRTSSAPRHTRSPPGACLLGNPQK